MPIKTRHIIALVLGLVLAACTRPIKLPEQADIGGLQTFEYAGIRVSHQYSDRGFVHFRLLFEYAPSELWSLEAQNLAVEAAFHSGAGDLEPTIFEEKLESAGAEFGFQSSPNGPVLIMNCLPKQLNAAWSLFGKCLKDPMFEGRAFHELQQRRVASVKAQSALRQDQALDLAMGATWPEADHIHRPSAQQYDALERQTAKDLFTGLMRHRCRLRLSVVGPIEAERISDLLLNLADQLPEGDCGAENPLPAPKWSQFGLQYISKGTESATAILPAPKLTDKGAWDMPLIAEVMRLRLHRRLVEKDKVAQWVDCQYRLHPAPCISIQLNSIHAFQCAEFALSELRKAKLEGFNQEEIEGARNSLLARLAIQYETAFGLAERLEELQSLEIANAAGNEALLWEKANHKQMQKLLKQNWVSISWGLVGDTTNLERKALLKL